MSDAALAGISGNPPERVRQESLGHGAATDTTSQTPGYTTNSAGGGSHVTTSGNTVSSNDPSTRPDASLGEKLKGDMMGAIHGTIGSLQAATGTLLRNKDMEDKGLKKMAEEDQRLGAKEGVMPIGSERRNVVATEESATNSKITK